MPTLTTPGLVFCALTFSLTPLLFSSSNPNPSSQERQRVDIEIQGLTRVNPDRLLERLGDRLIYARRAPATIARASDAAFFIERHLLNEGYDNVSVTGQPSEDGRRILIQVREGTQRVLGDVTFEGAENVSNDTLRQLLDDSMVPHQRAILTRSEPYVADHVDSGIDNIKDYYRSEGYWKIEAYLRDETRRNGQVDLIIDINEGPLFTLRAIQFNTPPTIEETLRELTADEIDQPATAQRIDTIRGNIARSLRNQGYQRYSLTMQQVLGDDDFTLIIDIDPGEILNVGSISVQGLERTRENAVLSRFAHLQGKTYNPDLLEQEVDSLLASGAFESVILDDTIDNNTIDFTLIATEGERRRLGFYGGVGSFEGFIIGSTYEHLNIFGTLRHFNARLEYTDIGELGEIRVVDQRFLGSQWEFSPRLFALRRSFDGYNVYRSGLNLEWERDFGKHYSLDIHTGLEYASLSSININRDLIGPTDYTTTHLSIFQTLDHRDSKTLPRDGWITRLETSLVTSPGSDSFSFFRGRIDGSYYQTIGEKTVLSLGARAGIIEPLEGDTIPIDQRFFLGGSTTVRGFIDRRLGPSDEQLLPIGGQAYHLANAELEHTIAGPFAIAGFADAGNLFPSTSDYDISDWRTSAGLGLRINLPTGPIRADYGWKLDQKQNESSGAFHFSIGVAF